MATKPPTGPQNADKQLAGAVRESAEQIWLAGLGAFAKAQEEGTKVFEALVQEGHQLQRRTRAATEERIEEVAGRFTEAASQFTRQASQSWDKLEQLFEDRVARALARLRVPSPRDIRELTILLGALNDRIEAMDSKPVTAARRARAKAATGTTASKASKASRLFKPSKLSKPSKALEAAKASHGPRATRTAKPASSTTAGSGTEVQRPRRPGTTADKA